MLQQAVTAQKKAEYRLKELVDSIPNGRLIEEKCALAAQLGIGVPQLNRLIRGDNDLSGTQLRVIAIFFGRTVDELYVAEVQETANQHETDTEIFESVESDKERAVAA